MAISRTHTWSAGEVLLASDLNAEYNNILNNAADLVSPFTKAISMGGFALNFDSANTMSLVSSTKGLNLSSTTAINDVFTTVASAATPDIWTSVGGVVNYTGTVTATGFAAAPQAGARRSLVCAGAAPFTAGANVLIDGYQSGVTYTATAGDVVDVIAVSTTQFRLKPRLYTDASILCDNAICDFRLTLTSGTAVTTGDVTGAGTLYCAPYKGNRIALYDGASWNVRTSAEFSLALTLTSGKPYDIFCYDNAGVPALEALVWTNDTTRATALTTQNGVLAKTGVTTRRYLGTIYASGSNTTEDSVAKRYVWNYYHRVRRPMRVVEATATWAYQTNTYRQARATATNQLDYVQGVSEDQLAAAVTVSVSSDQTIGLVRMSVGIGVDSTSANSAQLMSNGLNAGANMAYEVRAAYAGFPGVGRHTLVWLEKSSAAGTTTWNGTASDAAVQSGIQGEFIG